MGKHCCGLDHQSASTSRQVSEGLPGPARVKEMKQTISESSRLTMFNLNICFNVSINDVLLLLDQVE